MRRHGAATKLEAGTAGPLLPCVTSPAKGTCSFSRRAAFRPRALWQGFACEVHAPRTRHQALSTTHCRAFVKFRVRRRPLSCPAARRDPKGGDGDFTADEATPRSRPWNRRRQSPTGDSPCRRFSWSRVAPRRSSAPPKHIPLNPVHPVNPVRKVEGRQAVAARGATNNSPLAYDFRMTF